MRLLFHQVHLGEEEKVSLLSYSLSASSSSSSSSRRSVGVATTTTILEKVALSFSSLLLSSLLLPSRLSPDLPAPSISLRQSSKSFKILKGTILAILIYSISPLFTELCYRNSNNNIFVTSQNVTKPGSEPDRVTRIRTL